MQDRDRLNLIITAAQETKAEDLIVFDMEQRSPITDYVFICSGRSQAHVRGIAENVEKALKAHKLRYTSMEGHQEGSWVLMDYDVVLVHIFHPETRGYYDLEGLLESFPREDVSHPIEPEGITGGEAFAR